MKLSRTGVAFLIVCGATLSQAADLYYLRGMEVRRYDTVANTTFASFGSDHGVNGPAGGASTSGLAVGPDGTVYAEAQIGGAFGQHRLQRFNGQTGQFLGGYAHPTSFNAALHFGPDENLYTSAIGGDFSTGVYSNGMQRIAPATGAFLGNIIHPGAGSPLTSIPTPVWLPGGDMLVTHGDGLTIKRFDGVSGAYKGVFATVSPSRWLGVLAYDDGIVYVGDNAAGQVMKYRESDGALLGSLLSGPDRGSVGQFFAADDQMFVLQTDRTTFSQSINRYDLSSGTYLGTLDTGGYVVNFAMATQYASVPEPMTIIAMSVGALALLRRKRT